MNVAPAPAPHPQPEGTASRAASLAAQLGLEVPSILFEGDEPGAESIKGTGLKYALPAPVPGTQPPSGEPTLPETYGTGRLWLTARDPHCLYAHWDLKPEQRLEIAAASAPGVLVLRVRLENDSPRPAAEWNVAANSRHAFVEVPAADTLYVAELGYRGGDGQWRSVAGSAPVRTPREAVSAQKNVRFATFPLNRSLTPPPNRSERPGAVSELPVLTTPLIAPAQKWSGLPSVLPPEEALDAPRSGQQLAPIAFAVGQSALPGPGQVRPLKHDLLPAGPGLAETAPNWTPAQETALAGLIGWTAPSQNLPGSAEFVEGTPTGQPVQPGSVSELPSGISSFAGGEVPSPKGFWLNVNAELVIYGATEPGTRVTLAGREIQLRADGTFSFRFALPDGKFELPIMAVSPEGDIRQADLEFTRGTSYQGEVGAHPQDPALSKPGPENVG